MDRVLRSSYRGRLVEPTPPRPDNPRNLSGTLGEQPDGAAARGTAFPLRPASDLPRRSLPIEGGSQSAGCSSEPLRPEDYDEEQGGEDQGEREANKGDHGYADEGDARAADVEGAQHGGADEEIGRASCRER